MWIMVAEKRLREQHFLIQLFDLTANEVVFFSFLVCVTRIKH